jgi:hypothetical protein
VLQKRPGTWRTPALHRPHCGLGCRIRQASPCQDPTQLGHAGMQPTDFLSQHGGVARLAHHRRLKGSLPNGCLIVEIDGVGFHMNKHFSAPL